MTLLSDKELRRLLKEELFSGEEIGHTFSVTNLSEGLVPDLSTKVLINRGLIIEPKPEKLQPCGVDLRIGYEVYVSKIFLSTFNEKNIKAYSVENRELSKGEEFVCYPGYIYYFKSLEKIKLPPALEGIADPKSTLGRVGCPAYPASEKYAYLSPSYFSFPRHVWIALVPLSFPIKVHGGVTPVFQLRFRLLGGTYLSRDELEKFYGKEVFLFDKGKKINFSDATDEDGLRINVKTNIAFKQKDIPKPEPLDLDVKEKYDPEDYFSIVYPNPRGELIIEPHRLYLLGGSGIMLKNLAGRLERETHYAGFGASIHYAGFVDPGFRGELTLEFMQHLPFHRVIKNGDYIGRIRLEKLSSPPFRLYGGSGLNSSYQFQISPRLAKVFKKSKDFDLGVIESTF